MAVMAATSAQAEPSRQMITQAVNDAKVVVMSGNVRPEVGTAHDLGALPDSYAFPHLSLVLKRAPEREAALKSYLDSVNDKTSSNFHQWLTPDTLSERFGVDPRDIEVIKSWLGNHGITVNGYAPNMVLDISATAGQMRAAFGVDVHRIQVGNAVHIANISNPKVPVALADVLVGPVEIHDFKANPKFKHAIKTPKYTVGGGYELVVPGDLQTIYNITPVYTQGITGTGQTIGLIEDSDVYSQDDFNVFRKTFGLARAYPHGTLTQLHPTGADACADPGHNSADGEATLDAEWATAAAPNATLKMYTCKDVAGVAGSFGGFAALQNLLSAPGYPSIISISYGESEPSYGATNNLFVYNLYQTAAAFGVSVFVSSGDEGATSSDANATRPADHGITVTGWGETPYNISVGGTDFADTANGTAANYWSPTNGANFASALSYIPEIPWNNTCASVEIASTIYNNTNTWFGSGLHGSISGTTLTITSYDSGYPPYTGLTIKGPGITGTATITATQSGFNTTTFLGKVTLSSNQGTVANEALTGYVLLASPTAAAACASSYLTTFGFQDVGGGSGGPSNCATGTATTRGVKSGSCAGWAKPSWQNVGGNPSDGVRDIPDVSLFAANGVWGHYYTVCYSDPTSGYGGETCGTNPSTWAGFGGTSVSTPIMAGIQALINQKSGQSWGQAAQIYYQIAQGTYGTAASPIGSNICNSSGAGGPGSSCVFNDLTAGDMTMDCRKNGSTAYNCDLVGTNSTGATSTSNTALAPQTTAGAYGTTTGWDFASGLGSVNAYNLINNVAW